MLFLDKYLLRRLATTFFLYFGRKVPIGYRLKVLYDIRVKCDAHSSGVTSASFIESGTGQRRVDIFSDGWE